MSARRQGGKRRRWRWRRRRSSPHIMSDSLLIRELWLVHPEPAMCEAFRQRFAGLPGVRVIQGTYPKIEPHDCFVTAGNAFGIMAAVGVFGARILERVQHRS